MVAGRLAERGVRPTRRWSLSRVAWSQEGLLSGGTADSEMEFESCCVVAGGLAERGDGLLGGGV